MKAKSISRIVEIESIAARVYWGTLSTIKIQFKQKDTHEIPEHWTTFSSRQSLLSLTSNRNASNPANALLNYLYALLYAETRFGLLKAGLDPMAGVIHADNQYHDSFVFDVMEPLRPDVDEWLLEFVQNHKFSVKDFYEKRDGGIRLTLKITPFLAETIPLWNGNIEGVIKQVKAILLDNRVPGRNEIA